MSGNIIEVDESGSPTKGSPMKKNAAAALQESLFMTKDKVLSYANDIIRTIRDKIEQLDDPNAKGLEFGIEQVLTSPTVQATFDMYG